MWIKRTAYLGWHICGGCGLDRENPLCLEKVPWIERTYYLGWQMFGGGEPYTNAYLSVGGVS